ncbi:6-phosphogluconolactonase [Candidatus Peregrinibacteria bacterium]|nr:6-phosphogluconolactonase [Candidatus Peregrinibacteria bacterium]
MQIKTFSSESGFIDQTISFILSLKPKTIALSGGNTPRPIYDKMAGSTQDEIFYQVDERCVPPTHPDSNQKMIRETLFKNTPNPKNFHYFDTTLPIPKSLEKYEKKLPVNFDLCILGIGLDGHIASIFPDSHVVKINKVAHTKNSHSPIKDRLTLTLPTILASKTILILLKNKPEILSQLLNPTKSPEEFPALYLLIHKNLHIHYNQTRCSTSN